MSQIKPLSRVLLYLIKSAIPKIGFAINSRITFQLTSNVAWSVAANPISWCSVSPAKGKGTNTAVTITVKATTANTSTTSVRNCPLTFTATGVSPNPTRSVTQNGPPRFALPVQDTIPKIGSAINSMITFQLTSNVAWSVAANPTSWCSVSPAKGKGTNTAVTITVKATTANTGTSTRNCTLTFTATGVSVTPTRSVTQRTQWVNYTVGSVRFKMRDVPAKRSFVGTSDTAACTTSTTPACVTDDFYMGETEVTYQLWSAVYTWATATAPSAKRYTFDNAGRQGGRSSGGAVGTNQHPVTTVNWYDAIKFSNALTEYYNATNGAAADLTLVYGATSAHKGTIRTATGITRSSTTHILNSLTPNANATGFRLPSDGEWELAARFIGDLDNDGDIMDANEYYCGSCPSGSKIAYDSTSPANENSLVAWFSGNSSSITHAVKGKRVNALGLYDMSGNVWEWSFDWYQSGTSRIRRGGSWKDYASYLQVSLPRRQLPCHRGQQPRLPLCEVLRGYQGPSVRLCTLGHLTFYLYS